MRFICCKLQYIRKLDCVRVTRRSQCAIGSQEPIIVCGRVPLLLQLFGVRNVDSATTARQHTPVGTMRQH